MTSLIDSSPLGLRPPKTYQPSRTSVSKEVLLEGGCNDAKERDLVRIIEASREVQPKQVDTHPVDTLVYGPPTDLLMMPHGWLGLVTGSALMSRRVRLTGSRG